MKGDKIEQILKKIKELTEGYKGEEGTLNRLDWLKSLITSYQKYLPARVIEKIKIDPGAARIEGERRYITVLFADLSGFTALSETMDAEEIANIINDFFNRMVKIVHKYGGSVDKFLGDALMVIFGAPIAHHDDPERAVRAALEMQQEMEKFNAEKKFASPLSMSIGINTGPAVALNVGSDERMEYTVIGDTVNLAARLESISGPKEIIISQFTYEKIAEIVDAEKRPSVKVKGKKKPVVNYLVKGMQEHCRLPEITKIKFVGREAELNAIRQSLNQTKNNILTVVAICGEPGTGKTRLGIEGELLAKENRFSTFAIRCVPYEMNIPYNSFIEFFNSYFQFKKDAAKEERKLRISLKLKNLGLSIDNTLPYIGTIYGIEFPEIPTLPPDELKRRIFHAIKEILENEAKINPLFVRFEDLQWTDPTSIEILDYLLKELKHSPMLFLFEYRSDWAFPWLGLENCKNIFLKNFTREETAKLIKSILEEEKIAQEIENLVYEKSIGNPLLATEILKMLMIKNGIRRTKEGYVPTERFKKLEVAESVSSVILDQIDRMSEMDRKTLQYASVLGRSFGSPILSKILKISESNLIEELERLEHFEGILVSNPATNTYEFISPTTYEVVYNSLLKTKRKLLHTEIGRELERITEEKIYENLEKLAYHFARSNDERKGVYYLKSAADKSYRLYALKETLNFFEQALDLLHKKELSQEEIQDKLEVLRRQGWILRLIGNLQDALRNQKQSLKLARKISSLKDEAGANLNIGIIYQEIGIPKKGLNYWTRAKRIAEKIGDKYIQVLAENNLGNFYLHIGDLKKAFNYFNKVAILSNQINDKRGTGFANLNLGVVMERRGEFQKALNYYDSAYRIFEEIGEKENLARILNMIGIANLYTGDIKSALEKFTESVKLSSEIGDKITEARALGNIGEAYGRLWKLNKAYEKFSQSLTIAQATGDPSQNMYMNINIGDVYLYQGGLNQALEYHKKAIQIAEHIHDPFNEAIARRSIGWDYYYLSDYKKALEEFEKSKTIFQNIEDRRNAVISITNSAIARIKIGEIEELEEILKNIEVKAREKKDLEVLAYVLDAEADIFINKKDYETAQKVLKELLNFSQQIANKRLYIWTMVKLEEVQIKKNSIDEAKKGLEKALDLSNELGDKILEAKIFLANARILMQKADFTNSLNILTKAIEQTRLCGTKELLAEAMSLTGKVFEKIGKKKEAEDYQKEYNKIIEEITKEFSEEERRRYIERFFAYP
ncbi:MAG: tetratricopeptide repeat protein [candidate division WOR-3 bacterium]